MSLFLIIAFSICAIVLIVGYDGLIGIIKGKKKRHGENKTVNKVK